MAYCAIQISHHPQKVTGDSKTSVIRASGGKIMTYVDFSITAQHNEHRRWDGNGKRYGNGHWAVYMNSNERRMLVGLAYNEKNRIVHRLVPP
jgi:hypothetical protein